MSTTTISFDEIGYSILRPQTIIEVAVNYSTIGLLDFPASFVAFGQMATGTAQPYTAYRITRPGQAEGLFGGVCPLTDQVNAALALQPLQPLWAMGAPAPAGAVAATSTVTFAAPSTGAGTLPFVVGNRFAPAVVGSGASVAQQAATFAAVVNADPLMPVSAAAVAGVVTLTAKFAGALGNFLTVRFIDGSPVNTFVPGCSVLIADPINGAGLPDVGPAIAAAATTWYTDIILGWADPVSLPQVAAELERRFRADGRLDATAYFVERMTVGQALASTDGANARFLYGLPIVSQTPPWITATTFGVVAGTQLANDPARQLKTLALPGVRAPVSAFAPLPIEQEQLLRAGWSTFHALSDGTVTLQRVVSRYQTSPAGIADGAWRDIMRAKVATRIRYDFGAYQALVYPRAKLADDDSIAAQFDPAIATPRRLQNSWAARCQLYAQLGWIEGLDVTLPQSVVVRDPSDHNRANARLVINQLGNLMVFAARLEIDA